MHNLNDPTITAFKYESGTVTAHHLLYCYLEFGILVPEVKNWTEEDLIDNPPRFHRLKMLQSMLRAFGINDLVGFRTGKFIEENDSRRYERALSLISEEKISSDKNYCLPECFASLIQHREEVEYVMNFGSGAYSFGSTLLRDTYQKIWDFIAVIKEEAKAIDAIIVAIISPEEKSFSVGQLIREYDFPCIDIMTIDLDWL